MTRHGDLDGAFEPTKTPFALVKEAAALIASSGLKAVALEDARPAQMVQAGFNSSVNSSRRSRSCRIVFSFCRGKQFGDLGHLLHALIEEGKSVAVALGVKLYEDPWEMNKVGRGRIIPLPCSMTSDTKLKTEIDFLGGAIAREAARREFRHRFTPRFTV